MGTHGEVFIPGLERTAPPVGCLDQRQVLRVNCSIASSTDRRTRRSLWPMPEALSFRFCGMELSDSLRGGHVWPLINLSSNSNAQTFYPKLVLPINLF